MVLYLLKLLQLSHTYDILICYFIGTLFHGIKLKIILTRGKSVTHYWCNSNIIMYTRNKS